MNVSRDENAELFGLVIGGYGLFGVITEVDLRLSPRQKLKRQVEIINLSDFAAKTSQRINEGYLYGDLQFKTDEAAEDFLTRGVYSSYKLVPLDTPIFQQQRKITSDKWNELLALAHSDKGQVLCSRKWQLILGASATLSQVDQRCSGNNSDGHD